MVAVRVTVVDNHFILVIWQCLAWGSDMEENLEIQVCLVWSMIELNAMKQWVEASCQDPVRTWFLRDGRDDQVGEMTRGQVVMLREGYKNFKPISESSWHWTAWTHHSGVWGYVHMWLDPSQWLLGRKDPSQWTPRERGPQSVDS